jgi:hypothetical protein
MISVGRRFRLETNQTEVTMQAARFTQAMQPRTAGRMVDATAAFMVERAAVIQLGAIQQRRADEREEKKAEGIVRLVTIARLVIPAALVALIIGSAQFKGGTVSDKANLGAQLFPDTPAQYFPAQYPNPAQAIADPVETF